MCGIVGFAGNTNFYDHQAVLKDMASSIAHRGPDDEGFFLNPGVGLGFRRLSIIDLTSGHQPIFNETKHISLVMNGEIYNFQSLRKDLLSKGHQFKTNTDVECVVHLYEEYGVECLKHLNGMFAFALWDGIKRNLFLARDRYGKKPIYYAYKNDTLFFASELKAFKKIPNASYHLDPLALQKYLTHEYVPTPWSIFSEVKKLEAGHYLVFHTSDHSLTHERYWDFQIQPEQVDKTSDKDRIEEFDTLFRRSVQERLICDVPLGLFLSGGIDSSTILAYMAELMPAKDIKTFSIGFEDQSFDETNYARMAAEHFGTDHREQILSPQIMKDILPEVFSFLDEPFADASVVPTYLLSKFTRQHVTVALGGDGGDELLMGYPTFKANYLNSIYHWIPKFLHDGVIYPLAKKLPVDMRNLSKDFLIKQFLRGSHVPKTYREQVWLGSFVVDDLHDLLVQDSIPDANRIYQEVIDFNTHAMALNDLERLSYFYIKTYLHDDILVKVDRASMAVSLEVRAPFLDAYLADFFMKLPLLWKYRNGNGKYIVRQALAKRLPEAILHRPKKGFGIPIAKWFQSDLKEMVLDIFAPDKIRREGFFKPEAIQRLLNDHFSNKKDNRKLLWTLFVFEWWLQNWYS